MDEHMADLTIMKLNNLKNNNPLLHHYYEPIKKTPTWG